MRLVIAAMVLAMAGGLLLGGTLSQLAAVRVRWGALIPLGLLLQVAPVPDTHRLPVILLLISMALLTWTALVNRRLPGFPLILIGVLLNAAVITANMGMPVSRQAVETSGQGGSIPVLEEGATKHHLAGPGDRLVALGDVIPLPPPIRQVVSPGDVATYAGVGWFVIAGMRYGGRHRRTGRGVDPSPAVRLGAGPA